MTSEHESPLTGIVIDEQIEITLDEISLYCAVRREEIITLVDEGVIEARGRQVEEWRFHGPALRRAAKALRLQRELAIGPEAIALILDLMDEIERLRARLR